MNIKKIGTLGLLACYVCQVLLVPIYLWLAFQNESNWHTSTLTQIDNPEVLDLKIPMAVPYASDWDKPRESEGLIEYQGDFYTLVNIQLKNDTLNARYIKNNNAREIFGLLAQTAETEQSKEEQSLPVGESFSKWMSQKYVSSLRNWDFGQSEGLFFAASPSTAYSNFYQSTTLSYTTPPPKQS